MKRKTALQKKRKISKKRLEKRNLPAPDQRKAFEQLLDDAIFGVKKR